MIVCTDSPSFADGLLGSENSWRQESGLYLASPLTNLARRLFHGGPSYSAEVCPEQFWTYSFLVKTAVRSQFDLLIETLDSNQELPEGILCCAGSGEGFHGQRKRPWVALPGNVHLSAFFRPNRKLANCGIGFTVLGVVTVLQVLDSLGITRAQVKWVNDILIEKAKVGGVLVHIKTQGEKVTSALLGIGLNVENTPRVEPTPFVPKVAALKSFVKDPLLCTHGRIFRRLAVNLADNYDRFIKGNFSELLAIYRQRSIVLGRTVTIYEDTDADVLRKIAKGKVTAIGDNLELRLEGVRTSVWRGRLVLEGCNRDPKS